MRIARQILMAVLLTAASASSAFAEDKAPEFCTGPNCLPDAKNPPEYCQGQDCGEQLPNDAVQCDGQDCAPIKDQIEPAPEVVPVNPAPDKTDKPNTQNGQ
jgi:hypothetical protein